MKKKVTSIKHFLFDYRIITMGLIAVLIMAFMIAPGCDSSEEGNEAPDFTLNDLDGNPVTLSDMQGKVVFLNFWATTCVKCKEEMPDMEKLYQEYKDQDVVIIGVNLQEDADDVRDFVEDEDYNWIFLLDKNGAVTTKYEITEIPASYFLDTEGIIRAEKVGSMSFETMESNLEKARNPE